MVGTRSLIRRFARGNLEGHSQESVIGVLEIGFRKYRETWGDVNERI